MEVVTWFILTVLGYIGLRKLIIGLLEHDSPAYKKQRLEKKMKREGV